jgi:hypothetical protein
MQIMPFNAEKVGFREEDLWVHPRRRASPGSPPPPL